MQILSIGQFIKARRIKEHLRNIDFKKYIVNLENAFYLLLGKGFSGTAKKRKSRYVYFKDNNRTKKNKKKYISYIYINNQQSNKKLMELEY